MNNKSKEFCKCEDLKNVSREDEMFGYWLICEDCNKRVEDSFVYYSNGESIID